MLPLVLGGIALAAVGYGVKEYCESEGCPWDDNSTREPTAPVNLFESLHQQKMVLYDDKLLNIRVLLLKFEDVDETLQFNDIVTIHKESLLSWELEDDVKLYANLYAKALDTSTKLLEFYMERLETLLMKETHYKLLDKSEKKCIKKVYKVANTTQKLVSLRLLDAKVLNVSVVPTLKKIIAKLDVLEHHKNI